MMLFPIKYFNDDQFKVWWVVCELVDSKNWKQSIVRLEANCLFFYHVASYYREKIPLISVKHARMNLNVLTGWTAVFESVFMSPSQPGAICCTAAPCWLTNTRNLLLANIYFSLLAWTGCCSRIWIHVERQVEAWPGWRRTAHYVTLREHNVTLTWRDVTFRYVTAAGAETTPTFWMEVPMAASSVDCVCKIRNLSK